MLKFIMIRHPSYQHIENKELVYEAFKWEDTLPLVIGICKILIYMLTYGILLILLTEKISLIAKSLEIIVIPLTFLPVVIFFRRRKRMRNPFFPNRVERFLERNIRRYFVTPKGNALNKDDFKALKKQNSRLYWEITSDYCGGICYDYARDIALLFTDSKLIYCAATNPFEKNQVFAHVVLERNGEIFDTNRRMSYKKEDYETIFKVQIYKKWTYDEFSKENFQESVRDDFRKWCQKNSVKSYHLF